MIIVPGSTGQSTRLTRKPYRIETIRSQLTAALLWESIEYDQSLSVHMNSSFQNDITLKVRSVEITIYSMTDLQIADDYLHS